MSKMMRISQTTAKELEKIAKETGKSKQSILESALKIFSRELFLKKTNEEYKKIRENLDNHKEIKQEINDWDATLQDGLDIYE